MLSNAKKENIEVLPTEPFLGPFATLDEIHIAYRFLTNDDPSQELVPKLHREASVEVKKHNDLDLKKFLENSALFFSQSKNIKALCEYGEYSLCVISLSKKISIYSASS